jgi:SNF2 family DNA or RNA helicase
MWTEVLSFAQRPTPERKLVHGVIIDIDSSISSLQAQIFDSGRIMTAAIRHLEDRSENVREIVRRGGDTVRIECYIAPSSRQVVRMVLSVNPVRLDELMASGLLPAEVYMIALSMETWREARIPLSCETADNSPDSVEHSRIWNDETYPLFTNQTASVLWMQRVETNGPMAIRYHGNIKVTDTWFIDTESECFTRDPSWRDAQMVGGVCCDGTGMGKTATALRHIFTSPPVTSTDHYSTTQYECKGSLLILPLNIVSQWQFELTKFLKPNHGKKILWIVQGKDLRGITMQDVLNADAVFTTFHFLRGSKPYCEMVERTVGRHKTRAILTSWARTPNHTEPLIEAITWNRVVVDEMHTTLESSRDVRQLKLLSYKAIWGLTATPDCTTDHAQQLYLFLKREKAHHPNLLSTLISNCVKGTASDMSSPQPQLKLVQLTESELEELNALSETKTAEEVVKLCTFMDDVDSEKIGDVETIERWFLEERERDMVTLRARAEGHNKAVQILENASAELEQELDALAERCAQGDELASTQAEAAREAAEGHSRDLEHARHVRNTVQAKLRRKEAAAGLIRRQLGVLKTKSETCNICMVNECQAITPCAHLFCTSCVKKHVDRVSPTCPTCRAPLRVNDVTRVSSNSAIQTKLTQIGDLIRSLENQPVILFVQWKAMVRGMKGFMRGLGVHVLLLDGNSSQRATTLNHFMNGGVLILCMEDSFAGLHLPHARHVVFAHAIVGDRERVSHLERQAIARCVRHGQTGEVKVFSFVVADCEEETLWRNTHDSMEVDPA